MTGFEPCTSEVGSDRSANWATSTSLLCPMFFLKLNRESIHDLEQRMIRVQRKDVPKISFVYEIEELFGTISNLIGLNCIFGVKSLDSELHRWCYLKLCLNVVHQGSTVAELMAKYIIFSLCDMSKKTFQKTRGAFTQCVFCRRFGNFQFTKGLVHRVNAT